MPSSAFLRDTPRLNTPGRGDVSWGDYGSAIANVGGSELVAAIPATTRWLAEQGLDPDNGFGRVVADYSKYFQTKLRDYGEESFENLSPAARHRLSSDILTAEFWENPVSSTMLKLARTSPTMAAAGAAMFIPGVNASVAAGGASSLISVGQTLNDIQAESDNRSDTELQDQSNFYRDLRNKGASEREARIELNNAMTGAKPAVLAAIGGITGALGPGAQLGRMVGRTLGREGFEKGAETVERGLLGRVGKEFAQGGAAEGVQTFTEAVSTEQARVEGGFQPEVNWQSVASQTAEGALLGAIPGSVAGIPSSNRVKARTPPTLPTNTADPRAAPDNPPGADVGVIQTGPVAMPGRGGDTQSSPPIVPPRGGPAAPPVGSVTRPPNRKKPKAALVEPTQPGPESPINAPTEVLGATPTPGPTPDLNAPTVTLGAASTLVMDQDQAAAMAVTPRQGVAGTPEVPEVTTPIPLPQATPSPELAPAAAAPAPVVQAPVASDAPTPVVQAPVVQELALPAEVTPAPVPRAPRVLPAAPTPEVVQAQAQANEQIAARAREELAAPIVSEERAPGIGKDPRRNAKRDADAEVLQGLMDTRPDEYKKITTQQEVDALVADLQGSITSAREADVQFRKNVSHPRTPASIMWLREAETALGRLTNPKIGITPKLRYADEFLKRETILKRGGADIVKSQRREEGDAAKKPKPKEDVAEVTSEQVAPGPKATVGSETKAGVSSVKGITAGEEYTPSPVREVSPEVRAEIEARYKTQIEGLPTKVTPTVVEKIKKKAKAAAEEKAPQKIVEKIKEKATEAKNEAQETKAAPRLKKSIAVKPTAGATEKIAAIKAKAEAAKAKGPALVSGKQKLAEELAKVDRDPSPAQQEADNAAKAHIRVGALPISVSTVKNTERKGQDKNTGRRWSWLYKHHYGHILGTKGMDGQPVDVFLGPKGYPNSPLLNTIPVVVIDQVDPDTKLPDEHKVMLGFDTVADAVDAYEKSYPRGVERRGDVTVMSLSQFKAWVADESKTSKPAAAPVSTAEVIAEEVKTPEQELAELIAEQEVDDATLRPQSTDTASPIQPEFRSTVDEMREDSAKNLVLAKTSNIMSGDLSRFLDISAKHIQGSKWAGNVRKFLFTPFATRISRMAGDVKTYVLPNDVYHTINITPNSKGMYDSLSDVIYIPESTMSNNIVRAHTMLHEGVHAAVLKATYASPEFAQQVQRIFDEALINYPLVRGLPYGLTNMNEMLAEAFSNPDFQEYLTKTKISDALKTELNITGRKQSLWDVLLDFISKVFGLPPAYDSLMGAVLKVMPQLEHQAADIGRGPVTDPVLANMISHQISTRGSLELNLQPSFRLPEKVRSSIPERFRPAPQAAGENTPWALGLRSLNDLVMLAKDYSSRFYQAARRAADTAEKIRIDAENYHQGSAALILRNREAERKHRASGLWDRYETLLQNETNANVFSHVPVDHTLNKHLGKDTLRGAYPKARWAELNQEYNDIISQAPELRELRQDTLDFYTSFQNAMNFKLLNNILRAAGHDDPDLIQRVFDDAATEDDIKLLGPKVYDHTQEAGELAKIKGPYYPQMRRGNFVVRALLKIIAPTDALRPIEETDENGKPYTRTWEFGGSNIPIAEARRRAKAFAAAQEDMFPTVTSVWVDSVTQSRYHDEGTDQETKVSASDQNAEQRFRVTIQNRYVEFFETLDQAREAEQALKDDPDVESGSVKEAEEREFSPRDSQIDYRSHHMRVLADTIQRRAGFKNLSAREQNNVTQALNEASLRLHAATRIQSRRLQRKRVLGASRDVPQAMIDYSKSASGYLSRLDSQRDLDRHLEDMLKEVSGNDGKSNPRRGIANEILRRIERPPTFEESTGTRRFGDRLLVISFLDKLVSPAYNMLNMLQPIMITGPVLASRHGAGKSAGAMLKAYSDLGVGKVLKAGIAASKRALTGETLPSIVEDMKAGLNSLDKSALDHLVSKGLMDPDAGIEISSLYNERGGAFGRLDRGLDYIQRFSRQLPRAVEAINRGVTGLAAFRLELQRNGGDVDAAKLYMQEVVSSTQGNYSSTNAAPLFNHPLWRMSLQFKKYGQLVYGSIGLQIGRAYRNANEGDRAEAIKTLAYMAATHVAIAGALGLPTEPLKWLVMGANLAGLTGATWNDVENYERELLSSVLGQQLGEIAARGITRGLPGDFAFDLSSRAGLQDLLSFGEPRTNEEQDVSAYMADLIGGAPYSLMTDWMKGSQSLFAGDFTQAAQQLAPMKVVSDLIRSYDITSKGKLTGAGFERMTPYSLGEAAIRTFGFTPGREAESTESQRYFYAKQQRVDKERNALMHEWAAATGSKRARLWGKVEKFNYNKVLDEKLTRPDLDAYAKRRRTEDKSRKGGFRVTRRDKELHRRVTETYNVSP